MPVKWLPAERKHHNKHNVGAINALKSSYALYAGSAMTLGEWGRTTVSGQPSLCVRCGICIRRAVTPERNPRESTWRSICCLYSVQKTGQSSDYFPRKARKITFGGNVCLNVNPFKLNVERWNDYRLCDNFSHMCIGNLHLQAKWLCSFDLLAVAYAKVTTLVSDCLVIYMQPCQNT